MIGYFSNLRIFDINDVALKISTSKNRKKVLSFKTQNMSNFKDCKIYLLTVILLDKVKPA